MSTVVLDGSRRKVPSLARDVESHCQKSDDAVLVFDENVPPERILRTLGIVMGDYDVQVVVRHAELREYIEHAAVGVAIGAGAGVAAAVLSTLAASNPITLSGVLIGTGLGALIGGLLGGASTPISQVRIYRTSGQTRMKFVAAT